MKQYIVERRIMHAIDSMRMKDFYLIKHDCNERTIAHRLAIYLEQIFDGKYSVDCEYNREGIDPKRLYIAENDSSDCSLVYPDIIVHKRGDKSENILVIELKKRKNVTASSKDLDQRKLRLFTSTGNDGLGYRYGAYIEFITEVDNFVKPEIRLYSNGEEIKWGSNSLNYMDRWD